MTNGVEKLVLDFSIEKLTTTGGRIESCLDLLTYKQIWSREAETQNAIGNLILHLCGNVRQWIIAGAGGGPDNRQRDEEFAARQGPDASELKQRLRSVVEEACAVLGKLPAARLTEVIHVQVYDRAVVAGICNSVSHFCEHAGQIILLTKLMTRRDLGFFAYLNREPAAGQTP